MDFIRDGSGRVGEPTGKINVTEIEQLEVSSLLKGFREGHSTT